MCPRHQDSKAKQNTREKYFNVYASECETWLNPICSNMIYKNELTHARVAITHSRVEIAHSQVAIKHSRVAITHTQVAITNSRVAISHTRVGITHSRVAITHTREAAYNCGDQLTILTTIPTHQKYLEVNNFFGSIVSLLMYSVNGHNYIYSFVS